MVTETQTVEASAAVERDVRNWKPSGRPQHHAGPEDAQGQIREEAEQKGFVRRIADFLRIPFVKLVIGLGIFILAAIVYDHTVNFGSWTEKAEKAKATDHRGVKGVPKTPE